MVNILIFMILSLDSLTSLAEMLAMAHDQSLSWLQPLTQTLIILNDLLNLANSSFN